MVKMSNRFRFWILVSIVAISGFSQGMLLPLIAIIFENSGVTSTLNGLNATALYIGILLASPFIEYPLRQYGYKPIIMAGAFLVTLSLALFPIWSSFWFWFTLRLIIGVGDHALHFATQTWITSFSSKKNLGRNISLYGLFFGIGFAAGPLMTPLVNINAALPFIVSSSICLVGWVFLFFLKNEYPEQHLESNSIFNTFNRFKKAWKYGWVAFLPPLGYGFLESSINGIFPVYGLRISLSITNVSLLLTTFAIGSIITQLPLGILSDKIGRRNVLILVLSSGSVAFITSSFLEHSVLGLAISFLVAGMMVGSTFSLGISYMADLMPKDLLPTGNLLCGVSFSIGSLSGPILGGLFIELFQSISFFHVISLVLISILIAVVVSDKKLVIQN